ncbi:hypothetical protein ACU40P_11410 [Staphylococcus arlettae]|uniref:hypothetical protein n=1 Tax=Staphylococcus saprophyticus TaxID=29385 RepID=UPI0022EACE13|nr:hypothetical protein [Staphylococcus saprophyticus]MDW4387330.1 hypothetical protein [Staphylococcus saprophyticus]
MDIQAFQVPLLILVFVIIISLIIYIIDKMDWWNGFKKAAFIMWNIISAIFILLGTLISLIFIVFTAMLFASGKD